MQTTQEPPRPIKAKPLPPITDTADLLERFKDYPAIGVVSRHFNNPDGSQSLPILLKGESADSCVNSDHQLRLRPAATKCHLCGKPARYWHVRQVNAAVEDRWSEVLNLGYLPVELDELQDQNVVSSLVRGTADRYVRSGDSGKIVLMKKPRELYQHAKRLKRAVQESRMTTRALQADISEAAGHELGDEAGQSIADGMIKVESMRRSRSTVGEEAGSDE
jgi:hypothetical protein